MGARQAQDRLNSTEPEKSRVGRPRANFPSRTSVTVFCQLFVGPYDTWRGQLSRAKISRI